MSEQQRADSRPIHNVFDFVDVGPQSLRFTMDRMDAVDLFCIVEELQTPYSGKLANQLFWSIRSGHDPTTVEVVYDGPWASWYQIFPEDVPDDDWFTDYQIDLLHTFVETMVAALDEEHE